MTRSLALLAMLAVPAFAGEPTVPVQAEVVFASTTPGTVDPGLEKMRDALAAKVKYLTMTKLDARKLELIQSKPQVVSLPNQKTAELTLQKVQDNVATLKVKLPPTEAVYSLGREKSLFFQGGAHRDGELWIVVSQPK